VVPLAPTDSGFGPDGLNYAIQEAVLNNPESLITHGSTGAAHLPGAEFHNGDDFSFMYVLDDNNRRLCTIDIDSGDLTEIGPYVPYGSEGLSGLAMDPTTGTMYASGSDVTSSSLYRVDLSTGAVTRIGAITNAPCIIAIAADNSGQLFGVDIVNDNLVRIDKTTGAGTIVGALGYDANFSQGADFDPDTNTLYLAAYNNTLGRGELRIADTSTGATTLVGVLGSTVPGGNVDITGFGVARTIWKADAGTAWVDSSWKTVDFPEPFRDPVVFAGPATSIGWQPGVVRIRNVTSTSFEVKFQEWNYLDGYHCPELVGCYSPDWVSFPIAFPETPVVFAQVQTFNGSDTVTDRLCGVFPWGMNIAMQEQESLGGHCGEEIGYMAVSSATPLAGMTPVSVTHKPVILATNFSQTLARLREERSADWETQHWAPERVGFLSVPDQTFLLADIQTCNGADPCNLRFVRLAQEWQEQEGEVAVNHQWQTVNLADTYVSPVVMAGPATYDGSDPGEIRVRNVTPTSFQIRFQEWDYLDGWHCEEQVAWGVCERGIWNTGTGDMAIIDKLGLSNANVFNPTGVSFSLPFDTVDWIVATQQTANGPAAVTERLSNIQTTGFRVALQEEEAADGWHAEESLGFVALGTGTGGVMPPSSTAMERLFGGLERDRPVPSFTYVFHIVEEQSRDAETWHCAETIGGPTGLAVRDMQTCNGTDPCTLRLEITTSPPSSQEDSPEATLVPAADLCPAGEASAGALVTLTAPASRVEGGELLVFSHWEVNGEAAEAGQATIELEPRDLPNAVAVYVPAE